MVPAHIDPNMRDLVDSLQSAGKDQQEMHVVADKRTLPYRNAQQHRAVIPAIARHLVYRFR